MKWRMTHTICIFHQDVLFHKLYIAFLWNLAQNVYNESWKVNLILIHSSPIQSLNYTKVKPGYITYGEMSSNQTMKGSLNPSLWILLKLLIVPTHKYSRHSLRWLFRCTDTLLNIYWHGVKCLPGILRPVDWYTYVVADFSEGPAASIFTV
jgi:hypothetical protein